MAFPSRRQRLALLAIANYYVLTNHLTRTELARRAGVDLADPDGAKGARKSIDNFFQQGAERNSDKLYHFLKGEVANGAYYETAPPHIKSAIEEAYGFKTEVARLPGADSLGEILSSLADKTFLERLSDVYAGIWDVVRYAGRTGDEPTIVRAAMEIFPPDDERANRFPRFLVHHRPRSLTATGKYFVVRGAVIPLVGGHHMYFLGREADSDYPLDIIANQSRQRPSSFIGILREKQEQGLILAARAMFLDSQATSISDLTAKIGTFSEREFIRKYGDEWPHIGEILELAVNRPQRDGKGCLLL